MVPMRGSGLLMTIGRLNPGSSRTLKTVRRACARHRAVLLDARQMGGNGPLLPVASPLDYDFVAGDPITRLGLGQCPTQR